MQPPTNWGTRLGRFFLFLAVYFLITFFIILKIPTQDRVIRVVVTAVIVAAGGIFGWKWGSSRRP